MEKRYYWLQLKDDFFDGEQMDYVREQEQGSEYIYIYLRLCFLAANNGGVVERRIGPKVIPYTSEKLAEVIKSKGDLVAKALSLFEEIGLVETLDNGSFRMVKVSEMLGNESSAASRKRKQRAKEKEDDTDQDIVESESVTMSQECHKNVTQDVTPMSHACHKNVTQDVTPMSHACHKNVTQDVTPMSHACHKNVTQDVTPMSHACHKNVTQDVTPMSHACHKNVTQDVTTENRDKRLEIRDREREEEKDGERLVSKRKKPFSISKAIDDLPYTPELKEALKGWAEIRREQKSPVTERVLHLVLEELRKLGGDSQPTMLAIVNQTILRGWKGFFPLKESPPMASTTGDADRREQMKQAVEKGGW